MLVFLFLPILFIDNRSSHDWGDDFAQYIHQAYNIVHGIPQSETGFVYCQENYIGPAAYPAGFPLLLAPVYAIFGNNIKAFTIYISLFYFLLAFLCLFYYRRHFSEAGAIVLCIILVYNPQLLLFKQEVMSDLPFTVFLLTAILLYKKLDLSKTRSVILYSILTGFIIMIRTVGFVLVFAILIDHLIRIIKAYKHAKKESTLKFNLFRKLIPPLTLTAYSLVFYFLLNTIIFQIPSSGSISDYLAFYNSGDFLNTIPANLEHYEEVFRFIYTPVFGNFNFIPLLSGFVFISMTLFGFVRKVASKLEMTDIFTILYLLILLLFPNNFSAFRLLIPIGFLMLHYAGIGFRSLVVPYVTSSVKKAWILGGIMLVLFLPGLFDIATSSESVLDGPQEVATSHVFSYIRKNLPDSAVIAFFKPRALALYTGKSGFADPFSQDPTTIHVQLMKANVDYILINNQLTSEGMNRYVRLLRLRAREIWRNGKYRLYRIDWANPAAQY